MKIAPMLPSPSSAASSGDVETDLDGIDIVSAIQSSSSPSNSNGKITMVSTTTNGNGYGGEMFNPNVPEFIPKSNWIN